MSDDQTTKLPETNLTERRSRAVLPPWLMIGLVSTLGVLVVMLSYFLQRDVAEVPRSGSIASSLGFFLLINLNIIVVMVLVFLVAKNIITLVLDRKRKILGSKLRTRLVTAFVGLALVPTVLLFLVAKGILESVLQGWFSPQIQASVDGALAVAKFHYDATEAQVYRNTQTLSVGLGELLPLLARGADGVVAQDEAGPPDAAQLDESLRDVITSFLDEKRSEYGLFELSLVDGEGNELIRTTGAESRRGIVRVPGPQLASVREAQQGQTLVRPEQAAEHEFLRGYAPVGKNGRYVVVVTNWIVPEMGNVLSSVMNAYDDYKELATYRRPLASTYLLTLVVVTLLTVFAAIWVGFYLARGLTVPIGLLARGTAQLAAGNLEHQIPEVGDDELTVLVRSFNTMTSDLKETTDELVARRRYMETVLESVAVGVISIGRSFAITTCNSAAGEMLSLGDTEALRGVDCRRVLPGALAEQVAGLTDLLFLGSDKMASANVSVHVHSQRKHLQLSITKLLGEGGEQIGAVLLLDDVTELVSAQRMAAWREVARRIAHEIKNPLTPIQLSAQRMQRRFALGEKHTSGEGDRALILESTEIIVRQVENLRTLVNEFSRFARMPKSDPRPSDLNRVIVDAVAMFRDAHPEIRFELTLDESLPEFPLDPDQMGRALINLIDNGIASIAEAKGCAGESATQDDGSCGEIRIVSEFDRELGLAILTVADTGMGVVESDRERLFEPYFSTKRGGTGLGLAIVSTIVADHHGFIRIRDNLPRGAVFVIELPVVERIVRRA